jgi:hypothetical protein
MDESVEMSTGNPVIRFLASPLHGRYLPPMSQVGDYFTVAGIVAYAVSIFALDWMKVGLKDVFGLRNTFGIKGPEMKYGLFVSPWAWVMVAVLVLIVCGFWFVQTRGGITLGAGIFCLVFDVVFFIGAWHKINAIIGDVVKLARSVPFIGDSLGEVVNVLVEDYLSVRVSTGYWLLIPAGALLIVGGALRLASRPRIATDTGGTE